MKYDLIKGSSSLLFIISTMKVFYCSDFIQCKISNLYLIFASFIYNASEMNEKFLLYDYLAIYLVCTSFINRLYITIPLWISLFCEYKYNNSIENTKNISFVLAVTKSSIYTYYYLDIFYFIILLLSISGSCIFYKLRNYFYVTLNIRKYNLFLTYIFHFCIMNIIYISSITDIEKNI